MKLSCLTASFNRKAIDLLISIVSLTLNFNTHRLADLSQRKKGDDPQKFRRKLYRITYRSKQTTRDIRKPFVVLRKVLLC